MRDDVLPGVRFQVLMERFCRISTDALFNFYERYRESCGPLEYVLDFLCRVFDCELVVLCSLLGDEPEIIATVNSEGEHEGFSASVLVPRRELMLFCQEVSRQFQPVTAEQDATLGTLYRGSIPVLAASENRESTKLVVMFRKRRNDAEPTFCSYERSLLALCTQNLVDIAVYWKDLHAPQHYSRHMFYTQIRRILHACFERNTQYDFGLSDLADVFLQHAAWKLQLRYTPIIDLDTTPPRVWGQRCDFSFALGGEAKSVDLEYVATYLSLFRDTDRIELDHLCVLAALDDAARHKGFHHKWKLAVPVHYQTFLRNELCEIIKQETRLSHGNIIIDVGGWDERVPAEKVRKRAEEWNTLCQAKLSFSTRGLRWSSPVPDGLARAFEAKPAFVSLAQPFIDRLPDETCMKMLEICKAFNTQVVARDVDKPKYLDQVWYTPNVGFARGTCIAEAAREPQETLSADFLNFARHNPQRIRHTKGGMNEARVAPGEVQTNV